MEKENAVLIVGPTGIGKTDLSVKLAKKMNTEIISADSMQIYKYMDIGTAKIKTDEMDGIFHHMIDIVNPDENFSVADFQKKALYNITTINEKNKIPIIVGGSGLYINSLIYDLDFATVANSTTLREKYLNILDEKGLDFLYDKLKNLDYVYAQKISKNNKHRIMRALEIIESTGKKISNNDNNFRKENENLNFIIIGLTQNREKLYEKINKRVDIMLENGLIEEVKNLLARYPNRDNISYKAIGYKEVIEYVDKKISLDEMKENLKKNSRRFAKRQFTWFNADKRIKWFDVNENKDDLISKVLNEINIKFGRKYE